MKKMRPGKEIRNKKVNKMSKDELKSRIDKLEGVNDNSAHLKHLKDRLYNIL